MVVTREENWEEWILFMLKGIEETAILTLKNSSSARPDGTYD